jgi:capsular exopolysaccharide synthesis family protein
MNNLVPAAPSSFADLQMIPFARERAGTTPLQEILAAVYRQRWVIAAAVGSALLIALLFTVFQPKRYTASASVQLEQQTPRVFEDDQLDPEPSIQDSDRFLQTQVDLIRSRRVADAVAKKVPIEKSSAALKAIGVEPQEGKNTHQLVVDQLHDNVQTDLGLKTRVARISYTTGDANLSAAIANGFANALAEANISTKVDASNTAKAYLIQQIGDAKDRLENSERRMLAYARKEDLTTTVVPTGAEDRGGSLRSQQLGELTDSLTQATARRIDAQQRWQQMSNTPAMAIPEVETNKAIQDLVAQKASLEAALKEDRQRHTDAYPSVRETAAKISELNGQISSFASSIKSSLYGQYLAASQQERQLTEAVSRLRGAAMSERERSVGYNSLSREVETNKAFYDGLLQRYKEIAAASGATAANVSIVDRAWPPTSPDAAGLARNLGLGTMGGLILALLVGSIRERMHHVVRSVADLERKLNVPSLGVVPKISGPEDMQSVLEDPQSAQAEAYHSVAVALQDAASGTVPKTLLVTSSVASEGKSTSAIGIARSLSAMGKRVLLIDGDLRRPSSLKPPSANGSRKGKKPGLSDVLNGSAAVEKTVETSKERGFSMVRAGDRRKNPVGLLAADHIRSVFDRLAENHDVVIIDGPPVMGLADAVLLARSVESVVVVVEANRTHVGDLDLALSRLPQSNIIGGVITKFDAKAAGVRYGSYNYYTYRHGAEE